MPTSNDGRCIVVVEFVNNIVVDMELDWFDRAREVI